MASHPLKMCQVALKNIAGNTQDEVIQWQLFHLFSPTVVYLPYPLTSHNGGKPDKIHLWKQTN